jgi:hypothetical protein
MRRDGSFGGPGFFGNYRSGSEEPRTSLYVQITKRSRFAIRWLRAKRSDPHNPHHPEYPDEPLVHFACRRASWFTQQRTAEVMREFSDHGLRRAEALNDYSGGFGQLPAATRRLIDLHPQAKRARLQSPRSDGRRPQLGLGQLLSLCCFESEGARPRSPCRYDLRIAFD